MLCTTCVPRPNTFIKVIKMALELVKTVNEMTNEEVEEMLEGIRVRRLYAVVALQQAENVKLGAELGRLEKRMEKAREMLGKEINRLDNVVEKVEDRLATVAGLREEISHVREMADIVESR